jgi:hypothetical protein
MQPLQCQVSLNLVCDQLHNCLQIITVEEERGCTCPDDVHYTDVVPNSVLLDPQPNAANDGLWYAIMKGKVVGVFNNL